MTIQPPAGTTTDPAGSSVWSTVKRIAKGVIIVAGAIVTLFGAGKALSGSWLWWQQPHEPKTQFDRSPHLGLEFWQGDYADPMFFRDDSEEAIRVKMKHESFVLRLPKVDKDTAVQICAWNDGSIFQLHPDMPADDVPYLRQGRGFADTEFGSSVLFVNNQGRNYLIGDRLRRKDDHDQVFVSRLSSPSQKDQLVRNRRRSLFLVVYVDRNADRRVDLGEYEQIELEF